MKSIFDQVSFVCSQTVTAHYSTSFSMAVKMLAPSIQSKIHGIYGFVRLADEIVDSFHKYHQEELFEDFEVELQKALERKISLNPILNAFQEIVHDYNIDNDLIQAFMSSMKRDLYQNKYETVEAYNQYIYGSADVVGLMCLKVFVGGDTQQYDELKPTAMRLGSAFQKVNFLRDYKDDVEVLDRQYFPNIENSTLTVKAKDEILADIDEDFAVALEGIKKLPKNAKFGVYTAYLYYKRLLDKLRKTDVSEIASKRIRVSNPEKLALLAVSFLNYKLNKVSA